MYDAIGSYDSIWQVSIALMADGAITVSLTPLPVGSRAPPSGPAQSGHPGASAGSLMRPRRERRRDVRPQRDDQHLLRNAYMSRAAKSLRHA